MMITRTIASVAEEIALRTKCPKNNWLEPLRYWTLPASSCGDIQKASVRFNILMIAPFLLILLANNPVETAISNHCGLRSEVRTREPSGAEFFSARFFRFPGFSIYCMSHQRSLAKIRSFLKFWGIAILLCVGAAYALYVFGPTLIHAILQYLWPWKS